MCKNETTGKSNGTISVLLVSAYMLMLLVGISYTLINLAIGTLPSWFTSNKSSFLCVLFGLLGGTLYCIRAIYLNRCVRKTWDTSWLSWYFLRPISSAILGGMSEIFVQTGLMALSESASTSNSVYLVAFVAGLNVDRFLKKLEGQISSTLGVEPSRASNENAEVDKK
ncbi:hypothetical protein [Aeromonas hydrophila]|uniref:hypothetical protein n=1 Tax=Aeromonas hydrophila TaxID=644 RepID=UPI002B49307D|nr:hypothetical protein [Aeromonas hydrophila]